METRTLGRTGIEVSALGFGCGAVGGLMVRGSPGDQERAVARAIELGINYFDTAAMYGNGESERNLGRVIEEPQDPDIRVGTKVRVPARRAQPHRGGGDGIVGGQPAAAPARWGRSVPAAQPHYCGRPRQRSDT